MAVVQGGQLRFQCSSASRKFLKRLNLTPYYEDGKVSVLFSEPKIPQLDRVSFARTRLARFSALQRAENSSICQGRLAGILVEIVSVLFSEPKIPQLPARRVGYSRHHVSVLFSEPKIPQLTNCTACCTAASGFSALQRAENSSTPRPGRTHGISSVFQCSSASRKFLNGTVGDGDAWGRGRFSALQRAENSSTLWVMML